MRNNINFQPMPKRFMVWDKGLGKFLEHAGEEIYDLVLLTDFLDTYNVVEIHEDLVVIQSTNLFDENGEEIFEGSIVDFSYWSGSPDGKTMGLCTIRGVIGCDSLGYYIQRIGGSVKLYLSNYAICHETLADFYKDFVLVGHILSNPELVEKK